MSAYRKNVSEGVFAYTDEADIDKDKLIVVAYVILQPGKTTSSEELLAFGQAHLAAYKAPKRIYLVQDFPRTKNGKILRREIAPTLAGQQLR
jgi:acyl-coenzyme A synthetase/AMP-(fatty) acid ligase